MGIYKLLEIRTLVLLQELSKVSTNLNSSLTQRTGSQMTLEIEKMVLSIFLINARTNYHKIVEFILFFMAVMGKEEDLQIQAITI